MKTEFEPNRGRSSRERSLPDERQLMERKVSAQGRTTRRTSTVPEGALLPAGILGVNPRKPRKNAKAEIRPWYKLYIQFGLIVSLLVLTGLFRAPIRPSDDGLDLEMMQQEVVQMEEVQQTKQIEKPPPPPRPPVPVEVANDAVLDDIDLDLDASLDINEAISDLPPPPPSPVRDEAAVEEEEPEIFIVVEQMPEIIGGNAKVYEYLEYPEIARQAGLEGLVVIQVIVNPEGVPTQPNVARSAGSVLDDAAVKAVMKLRFIAGRQRGKAVRVRVAIPIRFRLRDVRQN